MASFLERLPKVQVTILASEWRSSKRGLSTINRELAIQLAKCPEVEITFFLPKCSQEDEKLALQRNIKIIKASRLPGFEELDWLSFPPEHLQIDVIVGHGVKLGKQAQIIKKRKNCKWIQVVLTVPEELGMFNHYSDPISKGEEKHKTEVELCEMADLVVEIGPKLSEAFRSYLRGYREDKSVVNLTPGLFEEFVSVTQVIGERKRPIVLVFGHGDAEDFELKGFDIAGKAVSALQDTLLVFVGAPDGEHEEIAERLIRCGVPASRLRVRGFIDDRESLKRLFQEVDLVVMPSRTEGFGLAGLEALSAGLPVLVSHNSGFGKALCSVPFGSSFVVDSEDPTEWTAAITNIWAKDRKSRLEEVNTLRSSYGKKFNWAKQIRDVLDKMFSWTHAVEHPWSHEPQEHDLESLQQHHPEMRVEKLTVHHDPFTVRRQVQPWEQAVSLEPYHNPESDSAQVTDSAQVSQEQLESLHHAMTRLSTSPTKYPMSLKLVPRPTETVETFSRQLKPEQSIQGELDVPDSAAGAVANVQVDEKLKRRLQDEGCFLDPEKYDPVKRLGHGGYARVFLVIEKDTGQSMACKMFDLSSIMNDTKKTKKLVKSLKTEVNVLSSLKHEHIVKFFRMEEEQETAILLLEYMEGGTLLDWLKQGESLQEPLVKKFTRQLLSAVNFLHTNGTKHVIHKDIKGANILLDKPRTNIKLADFGICTIMEQLRTATGQLTSNNEASFYWTSPELLGEETFGRNTDIWSVGCTVIEMLTTKPPLFFENLTLDQKRFRIVHCQVDPPENCSPGASEFLQRCLRPRSKRPSAAELLTDPFVVDQQQ